MAARILRPLHQRFSALKVGYVLLLLLADAAAVAISFLVAYNLRQWDDPVAVQQMRPPDAYSHVVVLYMLATVAVLLIRRQYLPRRGIGRVDILYEVGASLGLAWILALAGSTLVFRAVVAPRLVILYWGIATLLFVWIERVLLDLVIRGLHVRGHDMERVLIVGDGELARLVESKVCAAPELGYQIVGFIGDAGSGNGLLDPRAEPVLGYLEEVEDVVRRYRISKVIIAWPGLEHTHLTEIVTSCTREQVNIEVLPDMFELMATQVEVSGLTGLPLLRVRDIALRGWALLLKRGMDVVGSWALLVIFSPVMLLMALLIKLTSPAGPVLFIQQRVGLDGKPFEMIKFRSMRADAETDTGPIWAQPGDPRRTLLGGFMRRVSLDELPQLVNVLMGEMSLVGPRPERPEFVTQFARMVPRYERRHTEKAGLTGWAQVNGQRGQGSIEERTRYDLFYVENWSLAFDVKILLKTIAAVVRGSGAY